MPDDARRSGDMARLRCSNNTAKVIRALHGVSHSGLKRGCGAKCCPMPLAICSKHADAHQVSCVLLRFIHNADNMPQLTDGRADVAVSSGWVLRLCGLAAQAACPRNYLTIGTGDSSGRCPVPEKWMPRRPAPGSLAGVLVVDLIVMLIKALEI
jgi:hypothetical protein